MAPQHRDAWIARDIMGWRRISRPGGGGGFVGWEDSDGNLAAIDSDDMWFRPSLSVQAAWPVFEQFLDPNRTSLCPVGNGSEGLSWKVMYDDSCVARGRTAPEAICLAALFSKLTEVD
ncbi:BC1872 family protein [Paenibacillus sp. 1P03SA]|uniref:BC1872 family protein n=1 Tax=Paenibacillus sp. 1P03SA TaxID=3132294 RepID=UPI0039A15974